MFDSKGQLAWPGARSTCPGCGAEVMSKCGSLVSWHWAHIDADCDYWSQPESDWHIAWKNFYRDQRGAQIEVVMPPHRADVVRTDGTVVELQAGYLSIEEIADREAFYGPNMMWIYRCHWSERIHMGRRGFWWKHGSKAMTTHRRPVYWHVEEHDAVWLVRLSLVANVDGERVLGQVLRNQSAPVIAVKQVTS
jgi:competence CoiA-like predicted nuclease